MRITTQWDTNTSESVPSVAATIRGALNGETLPDGVVTVSRHSRTTVVTEGRELTAELVRRHAEELHRAMNAT